MAMLFQSSSANGGWGTIVGRGGDPDSSIGLTAGKAVATPLDLGRWASLCSNLLRPQLFGSFHSLPAPAEFTLRQVLAGGLRHAGQEYALQMQIALRTPHLWRRTLLGNASFSLMGWLPFGSGSSPDPLNSAESYEFIASAMCRRKTNSKTGNVDGQKWRGDKLDCGEDSFYLSPRSLGVADGVGGWVKHGVDPSIMSNALCRRAREAVLSGAAIDPQQVISKAYYDIKRQKEVKAGSSTFIAASLMKGREMRVANLGDSRVAIFGPDGTLKAFTADQQHRFNAPFQLAMRPSNSKGYDDKPEDAVNTIHNLEKDDIVVLGTDGIFDNIFPEDISKQIGKVQGRLTTLVPADPAANNGPNGDTLSVQAREGAIRELATGLCALAVKLSEDGDYDSPFSKASPKKERKGGKPDDITIVVAQALPHSYAKLQRENPDPAAAAIPKNTWW